MTKGTAPDSTEFIMKKLSAVFVAILGTLEGVDSKKESQDLEQHDGQTLITLISLIGN